MAGKKITSKKLFWSDTMKNKMFKIIFLLCCVFLTASVALYCKNKSETVEAISYVSWGTRGQLVRDVQQALKNRGYYTRNVDGIYGTGTYNAIVSFQRDNGLTADGIAGEATLRALGISSGTGSSGIGQTGQSNIDEDLYLLASAIHGEARGEPYEGQVAVGAVILNRVSSEDFPNSIAEVVYQRGAFDAVRDGQITLTPNDTAFRAAQDALNGWDPTNGALYYWNPATATSRWIWSVPITTSIGRHVFGVK